MSDSSKQSKGGAARAVALSPERRKEIGKAAAAARWKPTISMSDLNLIELDELDDNLDSTPDLPVARWRGMLNLVGVDVPCYVLEDGQKIIGRTSATEALTGIKGGGALEKYIAVKALEPFIDKDSVLERLVPFRLLEVEGLDKAVKGLPGVCRGPASNV
jgi:hypothetical protein